jgi:hypothetical protein
MSVQREDLQSFRGRNVVEIREVNDWEATFLSIKDYEDMYAVMVFDDGIALYFPIPFTENDAVQIEYPDEIKKFVEEEKWSHD